MKKLFYALAVILLVGGIIHLAIILMIPHFAVNDAWARLSSNSRMWEFNAVADDQETGEKPFQTDSGMKTAACLFDLDEAPLQIEAGGALPFWSAAVFDRLGRNIYSLNDRTAIEGQLLLLVLNPVQKATLLKETPDELETAVVVETNSRRGFVLLRAVQPDASWEAEINQFLSQASCVRHDLTG